jgi:hypothetical protein
MGSKMKIIRDIDGNLINIGDWDDKEGTNPLPEGAFEDDAEVVVGYDGGKYLFDDPKRLGK